jgi:pimeloyl-ACP methyl ester carboxylesterase
VEQPLNQDTTRLATSKDGTRIAFEKTGSGPAVIVVSGALSHRGLYRDPSLPGGLSRHFTVYLYDRRGRGGSTDVQPYSAEREIEDIEALLDDAGGSGYLYGVSSGGALALQAAAKLGASKVTKLAIYEPPYGEEEQEFDRQKQLVNELVRAGQPGDAAEFFLSAIGTPPDALDAMKHSREWKAIETIDFTLAYDFAVLGDGKVPEDIARAVRVPTLVMNGEKSMDFMGPTADRIAALVPHAQRKTLKGQTHQVEGQVMVPVLVEFFTGPSTR